MQTFLTRPTFKDSAADLDPLRLNKQLLECRQILDALVNNKGWIHHPATKMWAGYEPALYLYSEAIKDELDSRGIKWQINWQAIEGIYAKVDNKNLTMPVWWTDETQRNKINYSHKANLYAKDNDYYKEFNLVAGRFSEALAFDPLSVVCCATRRQGGPCQYYWPTHMEEK